MSVEQVVTGWNINAIRSVCETLRQRREGHYAYLIESLVENLRTQTAIAQKLDTLVNNTELNDFAKGVVTEAVHQQLKWGASHDKGKTPEDWIFLCGYLCGEGSRARKDGNLEKAKHHCISAAAAMANWHKLLLGDEAGMRPGIATPEDQDPVPAPVVTDEMVSRFLSWTLPKEFHPDGGVKRDDAYLAAFPMHWPTGTNLLHAGQARDMLQYVLSAPPVDKIIRDTDFSTHTFRKAGGFVTNPDVGVRILHVPTGLTAERNEARSQHKNRADAMTELRSLLIARGWKDPAFEPNFSNHIVKDASD